MARIQMYTTERCGFCVRAKTLLKQRGLEREEMEDAVGLAVADGAQHDRLGLPAPRHRASVVRRPEWNIPARCYVVALRGLDGAHSDVHDRVVRLLRSREDAPQAARARA